MTTIVEINVDLDGVLADFEKRALAIAGFYPEHDPNNKQLKSDFWKALAAHRRKGGKFFEEMDPLEDAFVLWEHLRTYHIPKVICSAPGHLPNAADEKRAWVRKHLGHEAANFARFVSTSRDKAQFAGVGRILIDDRKKSIEPWIEAGGIGILHKSAHDTIAQLKKIVVHQ